MSVTTLKKSEEKLFYFQVREKVTDGKKKSQFL